MAFDGNLLDDNQMAFDGSWEVENRDLNIQFQALVVVTEEVMVHDGFHLHNHHYVEVIQVSIKDDKVDQVDRNHLVVFEEGAQLVVMAYCHNQNQDSLAVVVVVAAHYKVFVVDSHSRWDYYQCNHRQDDAVVV